ncbi:helix-hairpin-helix domain-containing protein [Frigoribacterium sp. CFBP 8766]|uniref:ComEA family DNA-binding protein n=1 Tax=Frigoribacterium sp. CFBP 8766 TaxID=2775273 RepID=UPI0017836C4D|nr:helix-hairpin-helix domain-containing protein [Frigoribacterium sp. CFBP 8766]MBD8584632.1 helix-hairpin-helix domain-containing protein [Frigoribacterium sp. CFBP 8766]
MVVDFRSAPDPAAPRGPRWRLGVGAVVVLVLAVLAVTVAISAAATRGGAGETAITSRPTPADAPSGAADSSGAPGAPGSPVFVHVHGRVALPGLYELASGARVVDVVAAAGGFADDAEQGAVNLARPLVDGEQLYVPAVGETAAAGPGSGAGAGAGAGAGSAVGGGASGPGAALVDLNSADAAALETLPGVGPATSAAILEWRRQNGAFRSVDDLLGVSGIGEKTLAKLSPLVTV